MKKFLLLLIAMTMVISMFTVGLSMTASAAEATSNNVYAEDFESYEVGTNKNEEIYHSKKFMWFEASHHDTNIVERNGSKAVEYTVIGDDGYGYTRLGGIGTGDGGNLGNLIDGVVYTVSMDIEIVTSNPASEFYIEYKKADWTGVKFVGGQNPVALAGSTLDVKYENGRLEFSFVAGKGSDGGVAYITFVGAHLEIDDKVYIDNIEIKPYEYKFDYEGYAVGTNATSSGTNIGNIWNASDSTVTIAEAEGNKYLEIAHASTGADAWQVVYINNLWNLKSGWTYRLSMDVLCTEYVELYLCYPFNSSPNVTYSTTGYVGQTNDPHIVGGSFDGRHLTYEFIADTAVGDWAQVCIVIKHNGDMKLQLDNVRVEHIHTPGEVTKQNEVAPTCSAEGSYDNVSRCTECNVEIRETVTVEKLPHTEAVDAAVEATCSATGLTEGKHCSVCNEVLVAQEETAKLPHAEAVDAAVEATCSATGLTEGKHCSVCNEVLVAQEETAKLPHAEAVDAAVEATCTSTGKTEGKHCSECGEVTVAQEDTEKLPHTYDDDADKDCNGCGEEREIPEPVVVPWYIRLLEMIIAFFKRIFGLI